MNVHIYVYMYLHIYIIYVCICICTHILYMCVYAFTHIYNVYVCVHIYIKNIYPSPSLVLSYTLGVLKDVLPSLIYFSLSHYTFVCETSDTNF